MRVLFIIACLLFAMDVYAGQDDDAKDSKIVKVWEKEQPPVDYPTDWVKTDERPRFTEDYSGEPTYGDEEQPSFSPEPR